MEKQMPFANPVKNETLFVIPQREHHKLVKELLKNKQLQTLVRAYMKLSGKNNRAALVRVARLMAE